MRIALILMTVIVVIALITTLFFPHVDVFHSFWFRAILTLFCVNMTFCTIRQFKGLLQLSQAVPQTRRGASWQQQQWKGVAEKADIEQFLTSRRYRLHVEQTDKGTSLYADKGLAGRWGTVGVHTAILIIALGALIGNIFGFAQSIQIGKAETLTVPLNQSGSQHAQLFLKDFQIEYYSDGSVSEYISDITIAAYNEQVEKAIKINHPLDFKGITIYQMDYGYQVLAQNHHADGAVASSAWLVDEGKLVIDQKRDIYLQVLQYVPDFNPRRPAVSLSPYPNNPKVLYAFYQNGEAVDWGVADFGQKMRLKGYDTWITFADVRPFSLLDVKSDPGVPVVMAGFLLLSGAFFFSMLIRYHQVHITIASGPQGDKVSVAVSCLSANSAEILFNDWQQKLMKGDRLSC